MENYAMKLQNQDVTKANLNEFWGEGAKKDRSRSTPPLRYQTLSAIIVPSCVATDTRSTQKQTYSKKFQI